MWLFNNHSDEFSSILHPFQALELFLKSFSELDWNGIAISTHEIVDEKNQSKFIKSNTQFTKETANLVMKYKIRYEENMQASKRCREDVSSRGGFRSRDFGEECVDDVSTNLKQHIKEQKANIIILNPIEPHSNLCSKVD